MVCLAAPVLRAQESRATLTGRVVDAQGAVVPGASVTVTAEDTNVKQETQTNEQGLWTVRFLNPGAYTIVVSAAGFKTAERKGITLQVADMKQIDIRLELGALAETVVVTAEAPLIDTTAASSGTVIESEAVTEIPIMSRIPFQLATMSPGVQAIDQNQNVAMMWSNNAASQYRVNGGRDDRSNEFLLDGMPNNKGDKVAYIPPADAVAEFRIMSNAYDAQYGRQAGGTINVSVKSGSRQYRGTLYEFNRNTIFNANMFQSNRSGQERAPVHYNLYGGNLGGPVRIPKVYDGREKTFFFFNYEGIRNKDPRFDTRSVPTAQERAGDFNGSWSTRIIGGNTVVVPTTVFDPLTVDTRRTIVDAGGEVRNPMFGYRQPFPGNQVPRTRMSPIAQNILKFVPLPNAPSLPTGNASSNFVPDSTRNNMMASVLARLDHSWSNQHKGFVSIRWNHMDEDTGNHFHNVTTGNFRTRINRGIGLDHVWTVAPTKILNLRYNLTRFEEPFWDTGRGFDPTELGFKQDFVAKMEKLSFPRITGFAGDLGGSAGGYDIFTYHSWNASLTDVRGNMTLRYGAEFRILQEAYGRYGNQSGQFDFNSDWTRRRYDAGETGYGHTLASFLLGLPNGGSFPRNANRFDSQHYYGVYMQNDWRVTTKLTLNLGLRWDYQRPFIERFDRMTSNFDPTALNPISDAAQAAYANILNNTVLKDPVKYPFGPWLAQKVPVDAFKVYGAQLFAGVDGQPRTAVNGSFREFQPRIGFAYLLTPKTVIRGGFGRFVQASGTKGGQNGFSRSTTLITTQDSRLTAYDTLDNPFRDGILEPTGSSLGPMTNLGQGVNWINRDGRLPYSWEYSLHIQQEYRNWLLEIGYSHNKTYGIHWDLQQNDIGFENWKTLRTPRFDERGKPLPKPYITDEQIPNPFYKLPGVSGSRGSNQLISIYDLLRPIKVLSGQNRSGNPWGKNQYDAMHLKVQRRFSGGFSLLFAYTLSKLFEDTSFWGAEISGPIPEHKLGGEDRPHKVSIAPIYYLPFGRGKKFLANAPKVVDAIIGGWEVTGQFIIQSGAPVVFSDDSFFDGQNFGLKRNERTLDRWFDTTHFVKFPNQNDDLSLFPAWTGVHSMPGANFKPSTSSDPKNGVYANFGNYVRRYPTRWANVRASRVNEWNLGLFKNFRFAERIKAQLRGEFFNAFNHPRFPAPEDNPASANFGRVSPYQQNQPRTVQLALKLTF